MEMVVLVSATSYLLSQNFPNDNNTLFCIEGEMCACLTVSGKCGISSKALCDAIIMAPSGCFTCIPFAHGRTVV